MMMVIMVTDLQRTTAIAQHLVLRAPGDHTTSPDADGLFLFEIVCVVHGIGFHCRSFVGVYGGIWLIFGRDGEFIS